MKAALVLEDGTVFEGKGFGAETQNFGEIVFNTSMTGYQEILTDPSYCGQIVTMTYPLIGNYGINPEDFESRKPFVLGFVAREFCELPSNWRSEKTVVEYLKENGIPGICGIDTRALTRRLRNHGTMGAVIAAGDSIDVAEMKQRVIGQPDLMGSDHVLKVTIKESYVMSNKGYRVVLMDFGAKLNIARSLHDLGCEVIVVPAATTANEVLALKPDGIMLSNGPGDPENVPFAIETVRQLIGEIPMFGICLGHQIIALALGGRTYKLKFGHRGANHPVKDLATGKVHITSQNHGFAVAADSVPQDEVVVSHINLNDGTVEGLKHKSLPVFSVQYHPEAAPGPWDSEYLFGQFMQLISQERR
ncbi:glutamine-hydrolyzing carbamoyl-phosphate synthase small subunit [Phosphitispora fastidiosa]|uniref:glutamine-hydrolyzing carbamoyl-phosphate synthase small subunit n=1 Tax=Phosphitispora fastidiosa TaxID=2837202 RepID=UPI001E3E299B|nr:glutamine-hydrolyzing carbamoyl-phosphate synthase small subunit [Phosphitispora fastidiosa]MBU7008467.1 carbamoyl-phosphate synthase small subunit [Phosphitispora fastidiosa]